MSGRWWQRGVAYQVYPRSFQDSDGDGVGDLVGVRQRLDHLEWLGVDAVWLSPVFRSPMADFGYDVADYTDVDPLFGTLNDLDALIAELHRRGMRLLLDFVPNHTSDQHPWFVDARSWQDLGRAGSAIAYTRTDGKPGGRRFLVCLNLADGPSPLPEAATALRGEIVVSTLTTEGRARFEGQPELAADEGLIVRLD